MNRLSTASSPYLRQHAHNPVDWYPWGPEALARAQAEQKPILVSIGYSTCHWCHVMERESFEDEAVASIMNEYFVNIKVDREERPDLDAIYMDACQAISGSGGWPLNCFLTPETLPFWAGTYYPPQPAYGRPSWREVLVMMHNAWTQKREVVYEQAEKLIGFIRRNDQAGLSDRLSPDDTQAGDAGASDFSIIYSQVERNFDRQFGGFGHAPKFPSTMAIRFLMEYWRHTGAPEPLEHALFSLDAMLKGGIYDQLGGGFARYATDREWLVPHFEKMLYDNALLVGVLCDAYKIRPQAHYREGIEQTLEYIAREMTHPEGGFYAARDADSEGVEGKFFVWDKREVHEILGDEDAALFCDFYDVSEAGNWEGRNILRRRLFESEYASQQGMDVSVLNSRLAALRAKMFAARDLRVYPGLDDKIILCWNALMCSAYVAAHNALQREDYLRKAEANMAFLLRAFAEPGRPGALRHTWSGGQARIYAYLDDYAALIAALIDLWHATFDRQYLEHAARFTEYVFEAFFDSSSGLFYFADVRQTDLALRKKDLRDQATPCGGSMMAHNLQQLGLLLDRPEWRRRAAQMLLTMREAMVRMPMAHEHWISAYLREVRSLTEVAIVGSNAFDKAARIRQRFLPGLVMAAAPTTSDYIPLLKGKDASEDAHIYLCEKFACRQPFTDLSDFDRQLSEIHAR
ncbi:MAG: thioredoxin domain-containing protein [Saprospiraceae bacterium]